MTDSPNLPVPAGPLECPACHNADPAAMVLFAEVVATERFIYQRSTAGVPVFGAAAPIHVDPAEEPASAECRRCHTIWNPPPDTFSLLLLG